MLDVRGLRRTFQPLSGGATFVALEDVSLRVDAGQFIAIVGPSGRGKSTLLLCVAGLMRPTGGSVLADGRPVSGPPENLILVFQEYNRPGIPRNRLFLAIPIRATLGAGTLGRTASSSAAQPPCSAASGTQRLQTGRRGQRPGCRGEVCALRRRAGDSSRLRSR